MREADRAHFGKIHGRIFHFHVVFVNVFAVGRKRRKRHLHVLPFAYNRSVDVRFQPHVASDIPLIRRRGSVFFPSRLEQINIKETCRVSLSFIRNSTALFYRNFRASYRKIPRPYKYRIPFRGRYKTPCLPSACNPPQASFPRSAYRMNSHIPNFHNLFVGITSSFSVVFPSVSKTRKNGRRHSVCARLSITIRYPRIRFCRDSPQRGNFR